MVTASTQKDEERIPQLEFEHPKDVEFSFLPPCYYGVYGHKH